MIQEELGIPCSTLSGWFKNIVFTEDQINSMAENHLRNLTVARLKANKVHRVAKQMRIENAKDKAMLTLSRVAETNSDVLEIALAMLYLGEGAKADNGLRLGNSNPLIIKFYIDSLCSLYDIERNSFRAALHLRADQDEVALKEFWSININLPIEQFTYSIKDSRTIGRKTYSDYKGVCLIEGGGVAIQRKLMYLADMFCKRTIDARG
jgi:hypothetical protein